MAKKYKLIYLFIGILVIYFSHRLIIFNNNTNIIAEFKGNLLKIDIWKYLLSLFFYILGITFRGLRIYFFSKGKSKILLDYIYLQFICTGLQLSLPFRFGDGTRIYFFKEKLGNIKNSSIIFIIEKIFDTLILFSFLSFTILFKYDQFYNQLNFIPKNYPINIIILIFIFLSILLIAKPFKFFSRNFALSKHKRFIRIIDLFKKKIITTKIFILKFFHFKLNIIISLSFFIWFFDCLSFYFISSEIGLEKNFMFLIGPLCALSGFLPSPPLGIYGAINIGFYWAYKINGVDLILNYSFIYSLLIYGSIVMLSLFMFITKSSLKAISKQNN